MKSTKKQKEKAKSLQDILKMTQEATQEVINSFNVDNVVDVIKHKVKDKILMMAMERIGITRWDGIQEGSLLDKMMQATILPKVKVVVTEVMGKVEIPEEVKKKIEAYAKRVMNRVVGQQVRSDIARSVTHAFVDKMKNQIIEMVQDTPGSGKGWEGRELEGLLMKTLQDGFKMEEDDE